MKNNLLNLKKNGILLVAFLLINTMASAAIFTAVASGSWSSSATWTGGLAPSPSNTLDQITIPSGINVSMDNDVTLNGALTSITVNGTLSSSANTTLNLTYGTLSGNGTINIGSVIVGTGAAIAFTGTFTANTINNAALNLQTAANFMINESLTLAAGVLAIQSGGNLSMGNNATIVLNGGNLTTNGGTLGLTTAYNVHYKAGTAIAGLELGGAGLNNLNVEVGQGNTLTLASNLTVNGMLTLTSGTLVLGANNLTLNGDISASGNGSVSSLNSNIAFNSTSGVNGTLKFAGTSSTVNNLTVNVGNLNKAQIGGELTINGTLMLTSGTLQLNTTNLILKGGIAATGTGNVSSTSTSNITVNTAVSPVGELSFATGGNTVNNLTINIGGNGTLMLGSDLMVNGSLNLTSGHLDIDDFKLSVASNTAIMGASSSAYIITGASGSLSLPVSALDLSGVKFPIGSSKSYFPATVTLNVGSTAGKVDVGVSDNVYAQGTTGLDMSTTKHVVDATWMVTSNISSNMNMNLKVMWPASAEVNGFMRAQAYISHYTNNKWDASASTNATAETNGMYSVSRANITSLSPFAVFDPTTAEVTNVVKDFNFTIYPNPGVETIAINNIKGTSEAVNMDILNLTGQVVLSQTLSHGNNNVLVNELKPGYYFIRLQNAEMNSTQRFIKN